MLLEAYQAFSPKNYLSDYYTQIGAENYELLRFFAKAYQDLPESATLLEFSGGPTLYSLISAAKVVREIHFSDFLSQNLEEVKAWKNKASQGFRWREFLKQAMLLEGEAAVDEQQIDQREELLRSKISRFLLCDAFEAYPLGLMHREYYDVVAANFVAESITSSKAVWERLVGNICSTLREGGTLIMTAIQGAEYYCVNGKYFPAVSVTEVDLFAALVRLGFQPDNILLTTIAAEVTDESAENYKGYKGMIFVKAKK